MNFDHSYSNENHSYSNENHSTQVPSQSTAVNWETAREAEIELQCIRPKTRKTVIVYDNEVNINYRSKSYVHLSVIID